MSDEYFIITTTMSGGDYVPFWGPDRRGYTRYLNQAGRYSEAEAKSICRLRGAEFMVPCEAVLAVAKTITVVDTDDFYKLQRMS